MREQYEVIEISPNELTNIATAQSKAKHRLVQICAVRTDDGYELFYSFAYEYSFVNYKICIGLDTEILSISEFFPSAALYENEMVELFGVKINFINLDYKNQLYQIEKTTPFK